MTLTNQDKEILAELGATPDEMTRIQAVASYSRASLPRHDNARIPHGSLIRLIGRKEWLSCVLYTARNRMTPVSVFEWGDAKNAKVEIRFTPTMVPEWYREKYAIA